VPKLLNHVTVPDYIATFPIKASPFEQQDIAALLE